ncbi:MAG: DUF4912 domain-containing protein [Gemmataceae bacterium]|nr:DUF4912 domain-containing protein [Gemmataceae bacterium]
MPHGSSLSALENLSRSELDSLAKKLGISGTISLPKKNLILQIEKKQAAVAPKSHPPKLVVSKAAPVKVVSKAAPVKVVSRAAPVSVVSKAAPVKVVVPKKEKPVLSQVSPKLLFLQKPTNPVVKQPPVSKGQMTPSKTASVPAKPVATPTQVVAKVTSKASAKTAPVPKASVAIPASSAGSPLKSDSSKLQPDRVSLVILDVNWLKCVWNFNVQTHQQAEIALGMDWAGAQFVLRLIDLSRADHGRTAGHIVKEIHLPLGTTSWFLESGGAGKKLQVDLGYRSRDGKYYSLGQTSGPLVTPHAGQILPNQEQGGMTMDNAAALVASLGSVALSGEAMGFLEDRMKRSIASAPTSGAPAGSSNSKLLLNMEAEVHITGTTAPNARVLVKGEPVRLKPEGTFFVKMKLDDGRMILPATAVSADGRDEKTVILALERHTRYIDPSDREMVIGED